MQRSSAPLQKRGITQVDGSYGWVVVVAFFLAQWVGYGVSFSFGVFIGPIGDEMGWSRSQLSVAVSLVWTVMMLTSVFWGWLADRRGARLVALVSGAIVGGGLLLASFTQSLWQLYLSYGVVFGIGMAGVLPTFIPLVSKWFEKRRGFALGISATGTGMGIFAVPLLASLLISVEGWRFGYVVLAIIAWVVFLFLVPLVREPASGIETGGGRAGAADSSGGATSPKTISDLSLPQALRTRTLWFMAGAQCGAMVTLQMILVHLVPRARDVGIGPQAAAGLLTMLGGASVVGKVLGGLWGDRVGPWKAYAVAMLIQAGALVFLLWATSLWSLHLFAALFGFAYGVWIPQVGVMQSRYFGLRHMGAIFGATAIAAGVGGVAGPVMGGALFEVTGSYLLPFSLGIGVALAAALSMVMTYKTSRSLLTPRAAGQAAGAHPWR